MTGQTAEAATPERLAGLGVGIEHHFGGGVYAKSTVIPAGVALTQHHHTHEHLSVLASGVVELAVDGSVRRLIGPACVKVKAGSVHKVTAITPSVWYCIHATDCTDPALVDEELLR